MLIDNSAQRPRHRLQPHVRDEASIPRHYAALFAGLFARPILDRPEGKQEFVKFLGDGMSTKTGRGTINASYGYASLASCKTPGSTG